MQEIMTKLLFKIARDYCNYYSDIVVNEIAHPVLKLECMLQLNIHENTF